MAGCSSHKWVYWILCESLVRIRKRSKILGESFSCWVSFPDKVLVPLKIIAADGFMLYKIWTLLKSSVAIWKKAQAPRMAAGLSYYTMLSLAPLMMIAIAIAGYFYDDAFAQTELIDQIRSLTNDTVANTVAGLIKNATRPNSGLLAGAISVAFLLFGASGVFSQLYDTFNDIWHVPYDSRAGFLFSLQKRLIGIGMVLLAGALLVGTLMLSSAITYLNTMFTGDMMAYWLNLVDRSLSFLLLPLIFSMIFWFFPSAKIQWGDVWPAGLLTAMIVAGSRYLIELYLRFSSTSEVYGAAGSLVVLLIWVYVTGMIVFYGAAFSHAWAMTFGSLSKSASPEPEKQETRPALVPKRRVSEQ